MNYIVGITGVIRTDINGSLSLSFKSKWENHTSLGYVNIDNIFEKYLIALYINLDLGSNSVCGRDCMG